MTVRRAARAHQPPTPTIALNPGEVPGAIRIGPCVEVWGPTDDVPAGTGAEATRHFMAAIDRFHLVWRAAAPPEPNHHRHAPDAWTLDGRLRADLRLRPVVHDPEFDPIAKLAAEGYTVNDIARLRAQAQALLHQNTEEDLAT